MEQYKGFPNFALENPRNFTPFQRPKTGKYYLDKKFLHSSVPPVIADLLHLAALVMHKDRGELRTRNRGDKDFFPVRGWVRELDLSIAVYDDIWFDAKVQQSLTHILGWLTEDRWTLHFYKRDVPRQLALESFDAPNTTTPVILYSGGLDSLAGIVHLLQESSEPVLLLSVVSSRLRPVLKQQIEALQHIFGEKRIVHTKINFHLLHKEEKTLNGKGQREERTQRSRGFLFWALGFAQAVLYGSKRLIVCENGVGMLNLPFNKAQLGTMHTRSVHPYTIILLNQLMARLGFPEIHYEAPFLTSTKGQMCKVLQGEELHSLCNLTSSCDSFPFRVKKSALGELHCGKCSSCLLRRQAIHAAQLDAFDNSDIYLYKGFEKEWFWPGENVPDKQKEALLMMLDQVTMFQDLCTSEDAVYNLYREFPELYQASYAIEMMPDVFGLSVIDRASSMIALQNLLKTYSDEWWQFSSTHHFFSTSSSSTG